MNLTPTVRNLLLLNVLIFLVQENVRGLPINELGSLYAFSSPAFRPWQLVTYMFMHGSWLHLFSNMFGLLSFGPLLEQRWGGQRFVVFWLVCGVGAGLLYQGVRARELGQLREAAAQVQRAPDAGNFADFMRQFGAGLEDYGQAASALERNPRDPNLLTAAREAVEFYYERALNTPMVGASGALFGLLFAFGYLFPNTVLMLIFPPIPLKAKYFVGLYALYELYAGVHRTPGDNVAHFAHLGGLLIGFILVKIWEGSRTRFY